MKDLLKQALTAVIYGYLTKWHRLPFWLWRAFRLLPVARGATGMGCIGFPTHPVWEITNRCNFRCSHCHTGESQLKEPTTKEAKEIISQISKIKEFKMLVITGGEPLLREDLPEIILTSKKAGLPVVIATNGSLLTLERAQELKKAGVVGIALGIDGATSEIHEGLRNTKGSFKSVLRALKICKQVGIPWQFNITAMQNNFSQIPDLLSLANREKVYIVLMYQLIAVGRGKGIASEVLTPDTVKALAKLIIKLQASNNSIIEPVAMPQFWAYLLYLKGLEGLPFSLEKHLFYGCVAGKGLCYIKPDGEVWSCPFLPVSGGNLFSKPLSEIWENANLFKLLRDRTNLKGKCGKCDFVEICGGCRARAFAEAGDFLAEDPACFIKVSPLNLS